MSTFIEDEASSEESEPREAIEIIAGLIVHRIATGTRNIVLGGQTFVAYPSQREEVKLAASDNGADLIIQLPLKHPLLQRYLARGVPPQRVAVTVYRYQKKSAQYETIWRGNVTSVGAEGQVGQLRVPDLLNETTSRMVPTITSGRLCPHILYDANCKVSRPTYTVTANVTNVNGRVITVDGSLTLITDYATAGAVKHVASGEEMTIQSQILGVITMQAEIVELKLGDSVEVSAGCDHSIATCRTKFSNRVNFGGFPQMKTTNPFSLVGLGIFKPA